MFLLMVLISVRFIPFHFHTYTHSTHRVNEHEHQLTNSFHRKTDNENDLPQYFDTLAQTLRSAFTSPNQQKSHYLTSAPQCPFPDASNPTSLLLLCDFVFIQFYNNPSCELGSAGFVPSLTQWSQALSGGSSGGNGPRIYVGAPSFAAAGSEAYASLVGGSGTAGGNSNSGSGSSSGSGTAGSENEETGTATGLAGFKSVAQEVAGTGLSNLGGFMFWDGPEGEENVGEEGRTVFEEVKVGLGG